MCITRSAISSKSLSRRSHICLLGVDHEVSDKVEPPFSTSVSPAKRRVDGYWHNVGADTDPDISLPRKEDKLQGSVHNPPSSKIGDPRPCMSYGDRSFGTTCFSTADMPMNSYLYYIT